MGRLNMGTHARSSSSIKIDHEQTAAEVAWPLLCILRNATEAKMATKQGLVCVEGQLQQERETDVAASVMLASDLASG